jgi:type II secretory pathway pseudopilin PulG
MLEAVVALALFALVGSTLFAWINTNLDAAARLRERDRSQHLLQLATAWLQTLDPMAQPSGEAQPEPGLRLRWQARRVTPVTAVAPLPGGTYTPFRVALFEVDVTVSAAAGGPAETRLQLTRIGVERDAVAATVDAERSR